MRNREACERRVYRLAALLSGNPNAAADVITAVLAAQPNLRELDSAHMDRLTVLRSREIAPGAIVSEKIPRKLADALAALKPQQREAWVFVHIYKVPMREACKSMDCSITAMTQHMAQANEAMEAAIKRCDPPESLDSAAAHFRGWAMSIDVPKFVREEQARKKRFRILLFIMAGLLLIAAIVSIASLL